MTIPNDKLAHFCAGMALSLLGIFLYPLCILGFAAGIAKEEWDLRRGGWADINDVIATWMGATCGTAIVVWRLLYGHA